jgi:hypothetical protein
MLPCVDFEISERSLSVLFFYAGGSFLCLFFLVSISFRRLLIKQACVVSENQKHFKVKTPQHFTWHIASSLLVLDHTGRITMESA